MIFKIYTTLMFVFVFGTTLLAQNYTALPSLQDEASIREVWLEERVKTILPDLMRRENVDMWVIIAREYNEDPVIKTFLPPTWLAARRTTMLVMYDRGVTEGVECLAVARYDVGKTFRSAWDPEAEPDQWKALADIISSRNPKSIGVNISQEFALADGMSYSQYAQFKATLPEVFLERIKPAEGLAIGWLETRTPSERMVYNQLCRIAHEIIREGFSELVITPGVTATEDVIWWFRERIRSLGLTTWFHPTVGIQRSDADEFDHLRSFSKRPDRQIILLGDLLHCDIGIVYFGLHTDTQQHAYVLKPGETDAPPSLIKALAIGNKAQDHLTQSFKSLRTGNEILKISLEATRKDGIQASIYSHPIGYHGHAAGTTIGLWDQQDGVPGKGDYPLYPNTAHAIELNISANIPEWGNKEVRIMLEEDAFFDGEQVIYLDGRQKSFHLIPRPQGVNKQ